MSHNPAGLTEDIKNIYPLCLPAIKSQGAVSNQEEATRRGLDLIKYFKKTPYVLDLSILLEQSKGLVEDNFKLKSTKWSDGQLVPNLRTSLNYYLNSVLRDNNKNGIIIGTINRDEGSYLGYMGKAGD